MELLPCPTCKNELQATKTGPFFGVGQSIIVECDCGFRKVFFEVYEQKPQLKPTVWKTKHPDGSVKQEYYVPRKHDYVLTIINDFLRSS